MGLWVNRIIPSHAYCAPLFFPPSTAFLLSTQLNHLAESTLTPYCICILKKHVTNTLKDGRYVLCFLNCFSCFYCKLNKHLDS